MFMTSSISLAAINEVAGEAIVYDTFECSDDEVENFIKQKNKSTVPNFSSYKEAFKEVKMAQSGSGPGGCLTIFDTYEYPKLPDSFFTLSLDDLENLPGILADLLKKARDKALCKVTSAEFFEEQMDNLTNYKSEMKRLGIQKNTEPWLPQIMEKELEYHLNSKGVKDPDDAADMLMTGDKDSMDDYFNDQSDDFLDEEFIEN